MVLSTIIPLLLSARDEVKPQQIPPPYTEGPTAMRRWREHCTLDTCDMAYSYFSYRVSLAANATFLALFAASLLCFIVQAFLSKRFIGFSIAVISGTVLEVLGYGGRVWAHYNPFVEHGFLIQIVCLTIAPAFMAAGIYLTLSRLVLTFGPENSRLAPHLYPRIFIPCDVASLLLQAAGGGIASAATHSDKSPKLGDDIMVAGIAFQVFTLALFMLLSADFAFKTYSRMRSLGNDALDPTHAKLRASIKFKGFVFALALSTLCIFVRSVYRVVELAQGWTGALMKNQQTFIGFEGALVGLAMIVLNIWHPGLCFREGYTGEDLRGEKRTGFFKRSGKKTRKVDGEGSDSA